MVMARGSYVNAPALKIPYFGSLSASHAYVVAMNLRQV